MLPPPPIAAPLIPLENGSGDHHRYYPSILIIAAIIAAAIVAAASIHLLLRVISRSLPPPFMDRLPSTSSSSSSASSLPPSSPPSDDRDRDPKSVIDSLPLFSLASSSAKSSTSLDCAVCLSPFLPVDQLRLLPACRHAFHAQCIDAWLCSNLSCPLCRAPIGPAPSAPPLASDASRSDSFRVEIGSVSRRTDDDTPPPLPEGRSFSLGSSFHYIVEDEIEAVLGRVRRAPPPPSDKPDLDRGPPPPGEEVAELAGAGHRNWLKEYVDRFASSASSSFSSLRCSQRWSQRFDPAIGPATVAASGEANDLERNLHLHLEEDDGGFSAFYRWLVAA